MRTLLACAALLFSALSYGLIGMALFRKVQKFGDLGLALHNTFGAWPDFHWFDIAIAAVLMAIGTILLRVGVSLAFPRR